jgi:hypothetical protein
LEFDGDADMPKQDEFANEGPHAAAARRARELPENWRDTWASEEAALAALDSAAPASAPGQSKLNADGPSLHARQHAPLGSDLYKVDGGAAADRLQASQDAASARDVAATRRPEERRSEASEERKTDHK